MNFAHSLCQLRISTQVLYPLQRFSEESRMPVCSGASHRQRPSVCTHPSKSPVEGAANQRRKHATCTRPKEAAREYIHLSRAIIRQSDRNIHCEKIDCRSVRQ